MKNSGRLRRRTRLRPVSAKRLAARAVAVVDGIWDACYERDGRRCFRCGMTRGKLECHHRLSGGPDTLENRVMLHGYGNNASDADGGELCHGWVHRNRAEAQAGGWVISRHDQRPPQQIPVMHWLYKLVYLTADGRMLPVDSVVAWTVDGLNPLTEGDLARLGGGGG